MSEPNGAATTEQTPLIIPPESEVSSDTMEAAEDGQRHHDGPNQSVGTSRAVLITLSLWILIFLQGTKL